MNGPINSNDDTVECPLCMEPLEVDDLTFFPCTCGYQICRFCWHRIRTDENKLCPACRKEYPENPADFKPLSQEEMIAFKSQKRQRDQQRKQKITENRKHLANVRVVQKNLVFVVGLPPRLADADILKKHEYFGKYGKIHKVVINPSTTYAGVQGPSASAYVTYVHNTDALRAIQSVNNIMIDGRLIKTSLGTTKYCSHFMKNQQCPKGDCMYLHELGDSEASFTKEEMHQGKHQEYEKRLHDVLIATSGVNNVSGIGLSASTSSGNGTLKTNAVTMSSSSSSSTSSASITNNSSVNPQHKDAWPSLSVSPVNNKESLGSNTNGNGKSRKEKTRNDKIRHEKLKSKSKNNVFPSSNAPNKENYIPDLRVSAVSIPSEATVDAADSSKKVELTIKDRPKSEQNKEKVSLTCDHLTINQIESEDPISTSASEIMMQMDNFENTENTNKAVKMSKLVESTTYSLSKRPVSNIRHSLSSSSLNSDEHVSESSSQMQHETVKQISTENNNTNQNISCNTIPLVSSNNLDTKIVSNYDPNNDKIEDVSHTPQDAHETLKLSEIDCTNEASDALSKLNMFDESSSFFSSPTLQQALSRNKTEADVRQPQINNVTNSQLPDLLNGIDGYQNVPNRNEWEEAFKNVMARNNRHVDEQVLHQQNLQLQQQHHHQQVLKQQEEFLRIHELQKRGNLVNNVGLSFSSHTEFPSHYTHNTTMDANRPQPNASMHQQTFVQQTDENPTVFGGNMSKFFDFHKSQQQIHQQYINGIAQLSQADTHRLSLILENGRSNSKEFENGMLTQPQLQKQRLLGTFDKPSSISTQNSHSPQIRASQSSLADDDLGFDPFIETQKGLAELMENEIVQQNVNVGLVGQKLPQPQNSQLQFLDNMQRTRMPPPGFNHMNAIGFDGCVRSHSSKILPYINLPGNNTQVDQQLQIQQSTNWNPHLASLQHQGQPINDSHVQHQIAQTAITHNKGYSTSDWTAMDPAILSFRQYASFPHQAQIPLQQQQQDMFLQHLTQSPQQNRQGFSNQSHQVLPGISMPSNMINGPSSSQAHVNANVQGMLEFLKNRQFV